MLATASAMGRSQLRKCSMPIAEVFNVVFTLASLVGGEDHPVVTEVRRTVDRPADCWGSRGILERVLLRSP